MKNKKKILLFILFVIVLFFVSQFTFNHINPFIGLIVAGAGAVYIFDRVIKEITTKQ